MESTTWLEVVLKRLKFFAKPLPLAATVGTLLLAVFVADYLRNPEWFGAFEEEPSGPNDEIDMSGLSPEEQAAVSGIDNLTMLFNELGIEPGNMPQVQALAEDADAAENPFLNEVLALSQPESSSPAAGSSPFSRYLQQYQFGRNSSPASPSAANSGTLFGGINFNYFGRASSSTASEAEPTNPLTAALRNQFGLAGAVPTDESSPLSNELRSQSQLTAEARTNAANDSSQGTLPPGQFSSEFVTIPGVDFPVLPTLPQMSPPPGTTGYTPPASLDLMPPLPGTRNAATSTFPGTAATSVPGLPSASSTSAVGADIDVSNGYVTPYTPVVPTAVPGQTAAPPPFSVPRPPGSNIGGGYIHTFSNPNGPSN